jgi:diadenosine tetraphosphate (Ap4A) HIT family hydrolase
MSGCHFCDYQNNGRKLNYENEHFYLAVPREPAMYGHVLVVSKKTGDGHAEDIADPKLSPEQLKSMVTAVQLLARWMKNEIRYEGKDIKKVYVLTQCETPHFHFHLKPKYKGDESGDVFLCLKELDELSWITSESQTKEDKCIEGLKRLQRIELGLCEHRDTMNKGLWARENTERMAFTDKIATDMEALIKKHRSELDSLKT